MFTRNPQDRIANLKKESRRRKVLIRVLQRNWTYYYKKLRKSMPKRDAHRARVETVDLFRNWIELVNNPPVEDLDMQALTGINTAMRKLSVHRAQQAIADYREQVQWEQDTLEDIRGLVRKTVIPSMYDNETVTRDKLAMGRRISDMLHLISTLL